MTVKLHRSAYEYAQKLIRNWHFVLDQRSDWADHKPARSAEKRFIEEHGVAEFGKWHLGEDDEEAEGSKRRYKFPFGDFQDVHRCAVLAAEARAGQYMHTDIELAAVHLHGMLDAMRAGKGSAKKDQVPLI
jgi:arylsulfatase A-like enzyme